MKYLFALSATVLLILPFSAEAASSTSRSYNWSGYVAKTGTYSDVHGSWTVASGQDAAHAFSANAAWIGIGGFDGTNNLIQTGTRTLKWNGQITYQAWYELLPASPVSFDLAINPGDTVSASIAETASNKWRITMTNSTTGKSASIVVPYVSNKSSAEWIVERPMSGGKLIALTPFDRFSFSELSATKNGKAVTPVTAAAKKLVLIERTGALVLNPSALAYDGRSFTISQGFGDIAQAQSSPVRAL